ncbi:MAG: uncharacterized protein QOG62_1282 [Thermoleophilaceae bacterium]|nr:uncharacterized protein [Thermoleophilaceae bacterium]
MSLFGRSHSDDTLLDLLSEAGRNAERAGTLLSELLQTFPESSKLARDVLLCEQEGDRITHDIMRRLKLNGAHKRLGHADAYELTRALDDIVDHTEETADWLGIYGIEAPMEQSQQLADILLEATGQVAEALTAFRADQDIATKLVEIHRLENEGDRISRDAIASLFSGGVDPMVVIRWKDIFEGLERAIDACESVAHVLEGAALGKAR